ncbi:MAG: hypothetical protein MI824_11465 [Hyphomicrobiales bacterium]|nr:hypothetical protein [Hyphomicrobiales bacterium]
MYCDKALLIIREAGSMSDEVVKFNQRLEGFETKREMSSDWPGTRLHGADALVVWYRLDPECTSLLGEVTEGLYDWLLPNLPEDLCLMRADGTPWLVSITHEGDSYLELSDEEYEHLLDRIPEIESYLQKEQ